MFSDGKLIIPKFQQRDDDFTYVKTGTIRIRGVVNDTRTIVISERNSDLLTIMQELAQILGIKGASKMRKAELFPLVWGAIVFEE